VEGERIGSRIVGTAGRYGWKCWIVLNWGSSGRHRPRL